MPEIQSILVLVPLQTDGAEPVGDMYSVPDKSKKQKNAGVSVMVGLGLNSPG